MYLKVFLLLCPYTASRHDENRGHIGCDFHTVWTLVRGTSTRRELRLKHRGMNEMMALMIFC